MVCVTICLESKWLHPKTVNQTRGWAMAPASVGMSPQGHRNPNGGAFAPNAPHSRVALELRVGAHGGQEGEERLSQKCSLSRLRVLQ